MVDPLQLENIVLLGRTKAEYDLWFALSGLKPGAKVLDVGGGVSSFTAEARAVGVQVTAVDPCYALSPRHVEGRARTDLEKVVTRLAASKDNYHWDFYRDVAKLGELRERALATFLADYRKNRGHYVAASHPTLPIEDDAFDVVLRSHLLFLYDDRLDYPFHRDAVLEIARVASAEAQVYPLANLSAARSFFLRRMLKDPALSHLSLTVEKTGFAFVKNASERLIIGTRPPAAA